MYIESKLPVGLLLNKGFFCFSFLMSENEFQFWTCDSVLVIKL